eukprot:XP_025010080.1 uncharacterized protein LOC112533277 [Gallus gallus]
MAPRAGPLERPPAAGRGCAQPPPPRGITHGRRGPRKVPTQTRPRPLSARPRDWPRGLPIRAGVASPRREGGRRLACGAGRRGAGFAIAARPRSARERGGSGPAAPLPSAAARAATGKRLEVSNSGEKAKLIKGLACLGLRIPKELRPAEPRAAAIVCAGWWWVAAGSRDGTGQLRPLEQQRQCWAEPARGCPVPAGSCVGTGCQGAAACRVMLSPSHS